MERKIVNIILLGIISLFSIRISAQEANLLIYNSRDFGERVITTSISPLVGNPIHAGTGNKFQTETDLSANTPNGIKFVRYYNSFDERTGALGSNWRHYYERRVEVAADRSSASVVRADGKTFTYTPSGTNWVTDPDITATLTETTAGWTYTMTSGTVEQFDTTGRLLSISDVQGRRQSLSYDAAGNLTTVSDAYGRSLSFTYDAQNRITQMVTPDGNLQFSYDVNKNLAQVTYPDTTIRQYVYENTSFIHALTGIIDENNSRYATWSYDAQGRATSSEHAGGADRVTLVYNTDGTTTVTEANGQVQTFYFTTLHGVMKVTQIDGGPCTSCGGTSRLANYDANGFMSSKTDQNGNVTNYVNNARGLQTSRTEAAGMPEERTITTEWHANYSLPIRITEPGKVTGFAYDANGNLLSRTETDSNASISQTTSYTYNTLGQMLSSNGPRTEVNDVTTFDYDSEGNLIKITNALGHITRITAHDVSGRPLSLTDPNGLVTNLAYDARGRIVSRGVGGEVTSFTYDPAGNITRVTLPDDSYLDYHYDAAQRLTGIADQLGNWIDYQLDAAGNRTAESVFDSSGSLVRNRTHVYNELNQLVQSIGAAGQTTTYAYDANGNRISTTDANTNLTNSAFDALNRLTAVIDATKGIAQYNYDARDNLTAVTDPNGDTTTYVYDGLGNLLSQTSPDTGTTTFMHDEAGNVISQTDAKGQTTIFQYDALNRVVQVSYADGETFTYVYDNTPNGIGRLASVINSSGQTSWHYDQQGRVIEQVSEIMGSPYTTQYFYDPNGRLGAMRYPSGLQIDYGYTSGQLTEVMLNTQPLLSNISYDAFGGVKAWIWGNGLTHNRSFDLDGQLIAHSLAGDNRIVTYDPVGNITSLTDTQVAQIFNYDALHRLTAANDINLEQSFAYDPNSNRISLITPSEAFDYSYAVGSNLLQSINGNIALSYQYDANGNTVNDGTHSYDYDARNRLISIDTDAAYYMYNALGQRIIKTVAENETRFIYDLNGQLIAETDNTGRVTREYIQVNGQVVAMYEQGDLLPVDTIYDNTGNNISFNSVWIPSTSVAGYEGLDYQHHAPNGLAPAHTVIDNGVPEFSVTGTWSTSTLVAGFEGGNYQYHSANGPSPEAQMADNDSGSATGTWPTSTSVAGFEGINYQYHAAGTSSNTFTWSAGVTAPGTYEVYARWTSHANRASNATYTINHVGGSTPVTVNQQTNGGSWNLLGSFELDANSTVVLSDAADGYVIADAIQVAPQNAAPNTATWQTSAAYGGEFKVYAKWTAHANRASNATYTVHHVAGSTPVTVNQQTNGGEWNLLGTFSLDSNSKVTLDDDANGYVIADAIAYVPATALPNLVAWTPKLPGRGEYQVFAKWTEHANRASNATYTIEHVGGNSPVSVNQQTNGGIWNLLGTFTLDGSSRVVLTDQADGYVIADAVRIVSTENITNDPKVYYVHTDHLGTPRVITDSADTNNIPIWHWNSDPFGSTPANTDPDGDGNALAFNLRFPGQYYDSESGLHYNYFRYYNPRTGRYITRDPIGLAGGLNTYGYVGGNPLRLVDRKGLDSSWEGPWDPEEALPDDTPPAGIPTSGGFDINLPYFFGASYSQQTRRCCENGRVYVEKFHETTMQLAIVSGSARFSGGLSGNITLINTSGKLPSCIPGGGILRKPILNLFKNPTINAQSGPVVYTVEYGELSIGFAAGRGFSLDTPIYIYHRPMGRSDPIGDCCNDSSTCCDKN